MEKICKRRRTHWLVSKRQPLSQDQLQSLISRSYHARKTWTTHMDLYLDLFLDEKHTEQKARTHALILMCRNLRAEYACSFSSIYGALIKETLVSKIEICNDLLKINTLRDFIDSLYELQESAD